MIIFDQFIEKEEKKKWKIDKKKKSVETKREFIDSHVVSARDRWHVSKNLPAPSFLEINMVRFQRAKKFEPLRYSVWLFRVWQPLADASSY